MGYKGSSDKWTLDTRSNRQYRGSLRFCATPRRRQFSDFAVVSMLPQWTRRRAKIGIGGMSVLGGRPEVVDVRQNDAIDPDRTLASPYAARAYRSQRSGAGSSPAGAASKI